MSLNISYYRMNRQIKAFPKFNSAIYSFGATKPKALKALRSNSDFIVWCHDQYTTKEITDYDLADILGINHNRIDTYISSNKLVIRNLKKSKQFYPNTIQITILRRLQRGGYIEQDNNGDYRLVDVRNSKISIVKERYPSVEVLISNGFIEKGSNVNETVYNPKTGKYDKIRFISFRITKRGIMSLFNLDIAYRLEAKL